MTNNLSNEPNSRALSRRYRSIRNSAGASVVMNGVSPVINDPNNQTYPRRLITALDLFANALFGGRLDETISSRCSKGAVAGNKLAKLMVGIFNFFQPNHFQKAPEGDEARAQEAVADLEKNTGTTPDIRK